MSTCYATVRHWGIAPPVRLAYLRHAASVRPEPGSNSPRRTLHEFSRVPTPWGRVCTLPLPRERGVTGITAPSPPLYPPRGYPRGDQRDNLTVVFPLFSFQGTRPGFCRRSGPRRVAPQGEQTCSTGAKNPRWLWCVSRREELHSVSLERGGGVSPVCSCQSSRCRFRLSPFPAACSHLISRPAPCQELF